MTVAAEPQQLKTDTPCLLNSGCVASSLLSGIVGAAVRQTQLWGGKLEMATQLSVHVESEAVLISRRQPHIFIQIETQPAALQLRESRRRPC